MEIPAAMEVSAQSLETYYHLQQYLNVGWALTQIVAIASMLLIGLTSFGRSAFLSIAKVIKPWPLAAIVFYFSIALVVKVIQSTIIHHLMVKKSQVDESDAPSLLHFLAGELPTILASALLLAVLGLALVFVLRRKNSLTWLWLAVIVTAIASATLALNPYFSNTNSLGNAPSEQKIAQLLTRVGIPPNRIATEDCSDSSDCPPGHVIGLGPTKTMLLDRRLTSKTPENQLLQVVAHEAKHFVLDNDLKPILAIFLICSFVFLLTQLGVSALQRRAHDQSEYVSLVPIAYGIGLAAFLLAQPAVTTFQRNLELEADRFGLELNRDNRALIDIMRADAKQNLMLYRYTPITKYFRATHPQISDRIHLAETYQPWLRGEPLKYRKYISN